MAARKTKGAPERHLLPDGIAIEEDLYYDDDEFAVPLETDISKVLGRKKANRTKNDDDNDYNSYEAALEDEYFRTITLPRAKRTICRNHDEVDRFCQEAKDAMKRFSSDDHVYLGIDTEKDGSTVQMSLQFPG